MGWGWCFRGRKSCVLCPLVFSGVSFCSPLVVPWWAKDQQKDHVRTDLSSLSEVIRMSSSDSSVLYLLPTLGFNMGLGDWLPSSSFIHFTLQGWDKESHYCIFSCFCNRHVGSLCSCRHHKHAILWRETGASADIQNNPHPVSAYLVLSLHTPSRARPQGLLWCHPYRCSFVKHCKCHVKDSVLPWTQDVWQAH